MNRRILSNQRKKMAPSPEKAEARRQVTQLTKTVDYTNFTPIGRTRSLKSMGKYLSPERIRAGAKAAERDMRAYARSEASKIRKMRYQKKIREGYKRASAGFIERSKKWQ